MGDLTRAQLEADVKFRLGSRTDIDAQITSVVQMAYNELMTSVHIPEVQETAIMATSDGVPVYALPSDFYSLESVRNNTDGERLIQLSAKQYDEIRDTNLKQKPTHYLWWRNEITFYPMPDSTQRTILLRYMKRLPALSTVNTTSALPREWDEVIEQGAVFRLYRWMGQKSEAQAEYAEYVAMLQRRLDRLVEADYDRQDAAAPQLMDRFPKGI